MPLKTDYKNDVLDTSKNTKRKYQQTTNSDGTISLDDVTVYSQEGSLLGANDINATNSAVNELNQNLTFDGNYVFRVGLDGDGNPGYYKADGSLAPFKGKPNIIESYELNATSSNIKGVPAYPNFKNVYTFKVLSDNAKTAIISFSSFIYNGRIGYWRIIKNNEVVIDENETGAVGTSTLNCKFKTFIVDVKKGDDISIQVATSIANSSAGPIEYVIDICD